MTSAALAFTLSLAFCGTAAAQTATPKPKPATPQPAKPQPAQARPKPKKLPRANPRWFISADVAAQPVGGFSDTVQVSSSGETQTTKTDYRSGTAILGGGTVGLLFAKQFGAGVSVSHFSRGGSAHVEASVPHPFFFNQPRQVSGDATDLTRAETGVHILLMYLPKPSKHLRLVFSGGPSYLTVEQELVTGVQYSESYPYDTATFTSAQTERTRTSAFGLNVGADVLWMFNKRVGAGALLRYTHGTADLPTSNGRPLSVTAGGAQVGGGIRILY